MEHLSLHLIYEVLGGHTHVRVFAGRGADHRAKCGDLTFRNEEWDLLFTGLLTSGLTDTGLIELDMETVDAGSTHRVWTEQG
jgi:hypothetical protein